MKNEELRRVIYKNKKYKGFFVAKTRNSIVKEMAKEILRRTKEESSKIYVITGTHGRRSGLNYVMENERYGTKNDIKRDIKLDYRDFYKEDKELEKNKTIVVNDIFKLKHETLMKLIKNEHVIMAFCYSRNDVVVRLLI